jgi:hypothetical protein
MIQDVDPSLLRPTYRREILAEKGQQVPQLMCKPKFSKLAPTLVPWL